MTCLILHLLNKAICWAIHLPVQPRLSVEHRIRCATRSAHCTRSQGIAISSAYSRSRSLSPSRYSLPTNADPFIAFHTIMWSTCSNPDKRRRFATPSINAPIALSTKNSTPNTYIARFNNTNMIKKEKNMTNATNYILNGLDLIHCNGFLSMAELF